MARVIEEALVKSLIETGLRKAGEVDSQAKYALGCYRIDGGKLAEVFRHDGPMSAAAKGKCKAILFRHRMGRRRFTTLASGVGLVLCALSFAASSLSAVAPESLTSKGLFSLQ
jgi:hypothetical protein